MNDNNIENPWNFKNTNLLNIIYMCINFILNKLNFI